MYRIRKKTIYSGGSILLIIPSGMAKWCEIKKGSIVEMQVDDGKHGRFISFWNPKQQKKKA